MAKGPLDHPRLLAVDRKLDAGQLEDAQHLLAQLGDQQAFRLGVSYLATRLLFQRGILDIAGVVQRLETLLAEVEDFPQAHALLDQARAGMLERLPAPISSMPAGRKPSAHPLLELDLDQPVAQVLESERPIEMPVIPRGARLPDLDVPRPRPASEPPPPPSIPDLDVPGSCPPPGFDLLDPIVARRKQPLGSAPELDIEHPAADLVQKLDIERTRAELEHGLDIERRRADFEHEIDLSRRTTDLEQKRKVAQRATDPEQKLDSERPAREPEARTRYATSVGAEERIEIGRRAAVAPAREPDPEPRPRRRSRPPPAAAEPIVSDAPPPRQDKTLSLFEIAKLLDDGQAEAALEELEKSPSRHEPDHVLMRARVLSRLGRVDEAREQVARLGRAPLIEPEVRAGVARLALEIGELDLGLAQARQALKDDPAQPMVRLSFAWVAVRQARISADGALLREAAQILSEIVADRSPHEALLWGLRACIEAHAGDAERALALARRSLDLEVNGDALAALAMASARLGRSGDARDACARLRQVSSLEARALETSLARHGQKLFELGSVESSRAVSKEVAAQAESIWGPLELLLVNGRAPEAFARFAQLASDTLAQVAAPASHDPPALAVIAASFFTQAPISRDFAPYDQTPSSLARLEAVLDLVSGGVRQTSLFDPMVTLAGAYIGEVLREALGLRWRGSTRDPEEARVEGQAGGWRPFVMAEQRLSLKQSFDLGRIRARCAGRPRVEPRVVAVAPPCPWDPSPWPAPVRLADYAVALQRSVVGKWCQRSGTRLDGSVESLVVLDDWLDLVAPLGERSEPGWARRATVLAGAYLGETLRAAKGGGWLDKDSARLGPESYVVSLGPGKLVRPVEHVFARLTEDGPPLEPWAKRSLGS